MGRAAAAALEMAALFLSLPLLAWHGMEGMRMADVEGAQTLKLADRWPNQLSQSSFVYNFVKLPMEFTLQE